MRSVAWLNCETLRPSTLLAKGVVSSDMQCIATRKKQGPVLDEMILMTWWSSLMFFVPMTCSVWKTKQNLSVSPNSCGHLVDILVKTLVQSWNREGISGISEELLLCTPGSCIDETTLEGRKSSRSTLDVSRLALQFMEAQNSASFQVVDGENFFNEFFYFLEQLSLVSMNIH